MSHAALPHKNPVWPGYFADPFVLRLGREYFAYGTGSDEGNGRQPDGRVFPLLHSTDLVHWKCLGGALEPFTSSVSTAYWAPEVAARDGKFFMYYAADMRLRIATADTPRGPFRDVGRELFPDEPFSIDAHPFRDPKDGQWYLFFAKDFFDDRAGTGTAVVPLADDMMTPLAPPRVVVRATADWQIYERNRHWYDRNWETWHTVEGPFVVAHGGRYFCLYSGGRWETADYGVGFAVADHPLGPWKDEWGHLGPTVVRGREGEVLGPGHNSVVLGPDDRTAYVVYHAWDPKKTARRMCIDPLVWIEGCPRCLGPT